jgi:hypothetical protein
MLKFCPEPLPKLQERYKLAIIRVFDVVRIEQRREPRPGELPRHVLDCEDGLRLIVSREIWPNEPEYKLHYSTSIHQAGSLYKQFRELAKTAGEARTMNEFRELSEFRFGEISGDTREFQFVGWSQPKIVPHWIVNDGLIATVSRLVKQTNA